MQSPPYLVAALAALATAAPNHSLAHLSFSWDTLPRYTFCVNSSGPFDQETLEYVAKQHIFLNNPSLDREPPGSMDNSTIRMPLQAKALRELNPSQAQWFYYAIDLIRPHNFWDDHYVAYHDECRLKDVNGDPVPRMVWDFGTDCGVEAWLNTSRAMITEGGLDGIFIDGFQGCNPFEGVDKGLAGCTRVCTSKAGCDPDVMVAWNRGLVKAMWRLKREILGENGTLICNYTPGPFTCDPAKPIADCPCDGTNDERGGGSWDHVKSIADLEAAQGDYAMLTHVPHGNIDSKLEESVAQFLMAASDYQYHGSGFGYECGQDGWLSRSDDVERMYSAPLGAPLGPAAETGGACGKEQGFCAKNATCDPSCHAPGDYCVRTRAFATGTTAYVTYTGGGGCIRWSDGTNTSYPNHLGVQGCDEAAAF